jgi:uncharacterized repeat protein (TIGR02543 family)
MTGRSARREKALGRAHPRARTVLTALVAILVLSSVAAIGFNAETSRTLSAGPPALARSADAGLSATPGQSTPETGLARGVAPMIRSDVPQRVHFPDGKYPGGTLPTASRDALEIPTLTSEAGLGPDLSAGPNPLITNETRSVALAAVGPGNETLVEASTSWRDLFNGSTNSTWGTSYFAPSPLFYSDGTFEISRSIDGGATWSGPNDSAYLGPNTSWTDPTSWSYGDVNLMEGSVAASPSGEVVAADQYAQPCLFFIPGAGASNCQSPVNVSAPEGIAVATSSDGGVTWGATHVLSNNSTLFLLNLTVGSCGQVLTYAPGNYTVGAPEEAIDPSNGYITVAWDQAYNYYGNWSCIQGSVYALHWQLSYVWTSTSTDGGLTWSSPARHGWNETYGPALATVPSTGEIYLVQADLNNFSAGLPMIGISDSVDGGLTWTTMSDIPNATFAPIYGYNDSYLPLEESLACFTAYGGTFTIDAVPCPAGPTFSVATNASGLGIYVVWDGARFYEAVSSGYLDDPTLFLVDSADGGSQWSPVVALTANESGVTEYVTPALDVDPAGDLWLSFYTVNVSSGVYNETLAWSTDAGSTWSGPIHVSSSPSGRSLPYTREIGREFGDDAPIDLYGVEGGLVSTTAGTFAAWTDCRAVGCYEGTNYYTQGAYSAALEPIQATTNLSSAPVNLTIAADGSSSSGTLPATFVTVGDASVTAYAPEQIPKGTDDVWVFDGWSGDSTATTNVTTFTAPESASNLTAGYVARSAAWITGTVSPASPRITVEIDGSAVPLTPEGAYSTFNATVVGGESHAVDIAGGIYYTPWTGSVAPGSLEVAALHVTLNRTNGSLEGYVCTELTPGQLCAPASGTVTANGTSIPLSAGSFSTNAIAWGSYTVVASATGYAPANRTGVWVEPGATTVLSNVSVPLELAAGTVTGSAYPSNATVEVDGVAVPLSGGSFSTGVLLGWHNVTAVAKGYSYFHAEIEVGPGPAVNVPIVLTSRGWINGTLSPAGAKLTIDGRYQLVAAGGTFNASLTGDQLYEVEALASGFTPRYSNVSVTPGNVSYANLTLSPLPSGCTGANCGAKTNPNSSVGASGNSWLLYGGIGIVVAVLAVLAAILILRRGGGARRPPPSGSATSAQQPLSPSTRQDEDGE